MAQLSPLDPAPSVACDGVELVATEAGRTSRGLTASVQALNGTGISQDVVGIAVAKDRRRLAEKIAELVEGDAAVFEAKLVELVNLIESLLRKPKLKRRRESDEAHEIRPEVAAEKFGDFALWESNDGMYVVQNGVTYRVIRDKRVNEEYRSKLANFAARVSEDIALDDGVDVTRFFVLEGCLFTSVRLPSARVPVSRFNGMNWVAEVWGFGPSVVAGMGQRDHMRAAIEQLSGSGVPRRKVFVHLGWRRINRRWVFLHADGAVGAADVEVDIEAELQRYSLGEERIDPKESMRLSLSFLDLGDPRVTFPLWSAVWRAPLCEWLPCLVVLWLLGETGTFKSTVAALLLSHFGGPFDKDSLPASWLDTENRLEQKAFLAKDVPLVVDDFCPEKHVRLAQEQERRASRLIRAVGNRQARGRLRSDLSARKSYFPRGLVLSTAEQLPGVASSALARIFPVHFESGLIDKEKLSELQRRAKDLPSSLRGYLEYLAGQGDSLGEHLRGRFEKLRDEARISGHRRLPEAIAHLQIGLEMGVGYAVSVGAIDAAKAREVLARGWTVFNELAEEQAKLLEEERPTRLFLQALQEALASDLAWLADRKTGKVASGTKERVSRKLGWVDDEGIYLLPETVYSFVSDRLSYRGGVSLSERALKKMLEKDGVLVRGEKNRLESKPRCEGTPTRVLRLRRDALGELPDAKVRRTSCHTCGAALSSDENDRCPSCGWLVCGGCGSCDPKCDGGDR